MTCKHLEVECELKRDLLLATIIGVALFLSDFVFGWLTMFSGPIPVIFIMAIIIGIIAGKTGDALMSTLLSWVFGILIGILIAPVVFAADIPTNQSFFGLFIFVIVYSIRGMYSFTYEGNLFEVFVVGLLYLVVLLVISPIIYLFSFVFAVAGGIIGKILRENLMKKGVPAEQPAASTSTDLQ